MVTREYSVTTDREPCGGKGIATFRHWLREEERCPNLSFLAEVHIPVGGSVGDHEHHGEAEIYQVLSGKAKYNDNGTIVEIVPGDVMICYDGQMHGIENISDEEFIFTAIIINGCAENQSKVQE